jgi:hypothetical protein
MREPAVTAGRRRHRVVSVRLALLAALAASPAGLAFADAQRPIDPAVSRYERALRRVEGRAGVDPAGAAREAGRLRRQLTTESGGVNFTPDRVRVDRRLGDLQAVAPAAGERPDRVAADELNRNDPLPSSYAEEPGELPSVQREMRLVGRLLDRAADGLGASDATQASSDLAAAESGLAGLGGVAPEAELKPMRARMDELRKRLAALPAGSGDGGEPAETGR